MLQWLQSVFTNKCFVLYFFFIITPLTLFLCLNAYALPHSHMSQEEKKFVVVVFVLVMVMFIVHTPRLRSKTINNCAQISWTKDLLNLGNNYKIYICIIIRRNNKNETLIYHFVTRLHIYICVYCINEEGKDQYEPTHCTIKFSHHGIKINIKFMWTQAGFRFFITIRHEILMRRFKRRQVSEEEIPFTISHPNMTDWSGDNT